MEGVVKNGNSSGAAAAQVPAANGGHTIEGQEVGSSGPGDTVASEPVATPSSAAVTPPLPAPPAAGGGGGSGGGQAKSTRPPCAFFLSNSCRHGDQCRFSHDPKHLTNPPPASQRPSPPGSGGSPYAPDASGKPPPILMIQTPPGHPIFSIDVECVATGVQHNARSIAQVALG